MLLPNFKEHTPVDNATKLNVHPLLVQKVEKGNTSVKIQMYATQYEWAKMGFTELLQGRNGSQICHAI